VRLDQYNSSSIFSILIIVCIATGICAQSNYINSANTSLKQQDYQRAEELYAKANEHCSETDKVKQNTAILMALQGDFELALSTLTESIKKISDNASLFFNRALVKLNKGDFLSAIDDFKHARKLGAKEKSKSEKNANNLKKQSEKKQVEALQKLAESETIAGHYEQANKYYEAALAIMPHEAQLLFSQANLGLLQGNPFMSLEALEKIKHTGTANEQQLELTLLKAYSLARINKMHEAIRLLEHVLYSSEGADIRVRELLSYYYVRLSKFQKALDVLSGRHFSSANTFVVAGNAALRLKKYKHALYCFKEAKSLDNANINAALGIALCYSSTNRNDESIPYIDSLTLEYPENHNVWNVKGIIHKDVGLYYKNKFRENLAKNFFVTSAAAFFNAQQLNTHMKDVYDSNRALALFFQNQKETAKLIWLENDELSSQNNLALFYASQREFNTAYQLLDELNDDFWAKNKKKHNIIDYNRGLARSRTSLNNNYKFLTYFKLNQDRPTLEVNNPFTIQAHSDINRTDSFEYILAYSDKDCKEQINRKKSKKKKRFKLFKRKKKKYKGDCPSF